MVKSGHDFSRHRIHGLYRKRIPGIVRQSYIHIRIHPDLHSGLVKFAQIDGITISLLVEGALWKFLSKETARRGGRVVERLRHSQALVREVIAIATEFAAPEPAKVPLQAEKVAPNVQDREVRQNRRSRISQKTENAFDEVYELCHAKQISEQDALRGSMYAILARLAEVNEHILAGAAKEEILQDLDKLGEANDRYEQLTARLEAEVAEKAAALR